MTSVESTNRPTLSPQPRDGAVGPARLGCFELPWVIWKPKISSCGLRDGRVTSYVLRRPRPWWRALFHVLLQKLGGPCPSIRDH
jgi:hypothetical protein